jgi:hypothetical protein
MTDIILSKFTVEERRDTAVGNLRLESHPTIHKLQQGLPCLAIAYR